MQSKAIALLFCVIVGIGKQKVPLHLAILFVKERYCSYRAIVMLNIIIVAYSRHDVKCVLNKIVFVTKEKRDRKLGRVFQKVIKTMNKMMIKVQHTWVLL